MRPILTHAKSMEVIYHVQRHHKLESTYAMRLQIKWRDGWAYSSGTGLSGRRIRRALKTKDARRAEELRADLENRLWRGNLYGVDVVTTFDQAAVHYAEDGGEARFLVKISEQLSGVLLKSITPQIVRNAAKKAYPTTQRRCATAKALLQRRRSSTTHISKGGAVPYE